MKDKNITLNYKFENKSIITPFNPPQIKLMGPGPSDVYPESFSALSRPTLGHLDPLFIKMMDETKYFAICVSD